MSATPVHAVTLPPLYGKYRGVVINNLDPLQTGRVLIEVPVLGIIPSSWALPCVPFAGQGCGTFFVPPIGANVWVEFEGGQRDYPIWSGGFWPQAAAVPSQALVPVAAPGQNIVIQTEGQNALLLSDSPTEGIVLKSATGALIQINGNGITISNGKGAIITMTGPAVTINEGAFTVV